jgi:hypothetical protein
MPEFRLVPVRGSTEYGSQGGCTAELLADLKLPIDTAKALAKLGNLGVAKSTWSTYKTAQTMVSKCQKDTNIDMSLPFYERKTLIFIDWLVRIRGVKGATANSYLAGVRQLHVVKNIDPSGGAESVLRVATPFGFGYSLLNQPPCGSVHTVSSFPAPPTLW